MLIIAGLAMGLRNQLREQMVSRDGEVFVAVASAELVDVRELNQGLFDPGSDEELFEVALNTSEIRGVIGVRVYKEEDVFVGAVPFSMKRGFISVDDEIELIDRQVISRYYSNMDLSMIYLVDDYEAAVTYPVLEVLIPLYAGDDEGVEGYAQYFIDGTELGKELAALDRNILTYAGGAFLLGAVLSGGALFWAFRRLRVTNSLLEDRTKNLIAANHKLSMEARTAAIGAITSHLIHGLKGPLQGIRQFVTTQSSGAGAETGDEVWKDAVDTAEQMQRLINEVTEVLQDRSGEFSYEISLAEISTLLQAKVSPFSKDSGVHIQVEEIGKLEGAMVSNDKANLVILILINLVRNGIEASQAGNTVTVCLRALDDERYQFDVCDEGEGLSQHVQDNLFQPVHTSKETGSGIGLSLCQELSRHVGGELSLAQTGPKGTTFQLNLSKLT